MIAILFSKIAHNAKKNLETRKIYFVQENVTMITENHLNKPAHNAVKNSHQNTDPKKNVVLKNAAE